jgi:hypothetical protein
MSWRDLNTHVANVEGETGGKDVHGRWKKARLNPENIRVRADGIHEVLLNISWPSTELDFEAF